MVERDLARSAIAGTGAVAVQTAAEALFHRGGERLLSHAAKRALRGVVIESSAGALELATPTLLGRIARVVGDEAARELTRRGGRLLAGRAARSAAHEVLHVAVRAGGLALAFDAAFGINEGISRYRKGEATAREACVHAAKEAATGAFATAAGVALGAGLVAVTGPVSVPVMFAVGAGGSILAKVGIDRVVARREARPLALPAFAG